MTKYFSGSVYGISFIACSQFAQAADMYNITASAGLMLDDNITRAQYSRDIYDDRAWFAGLCADYTLTLGNHSRTLLYANAETWRYQNSNLDHNLLSLQAEYLFQPSTGFTAPWYTLSVIYGVSAYDNVYRDARFYEFGLAMAKRITDATNIRTGITRYDNSADHEIFSITSTRLYGQLDFKFDQNTLYTSLAYHTGDITSTNTPPHPGSLNALPWINDDAAFPGLNNTWTYRLDADTWSLRLGYVYAISGDQSLDASVLYYTATAYGENNYDGIISNITYFYRF